MPTTYEECSPRMLAARVLSGMPLEEAPAAAPASSASFRRRPGSNWHSASQGLEPQVAPVGPVARAVAPGRMGFHPYQKVSPPRMVTNQQIEQQKRAEKQMQAAAEHRAKMAAKAAQEAAALREQQAKHAPFPPPAQAPPPQPPVMAPPLARPHAPPPVMMHAVHPPTLPYPTHHVAGPSPLNPHHLVPSPTVSQPAAYARPEWHAPPPLQTTHVPRPPTILSIQQGQLMGQPGAAAASHAAPPPQPPPIAAGRGTPPMPTPHSMPLPPPTAPMPPPMIMQRMPAGPAPLPQWNGAWVPQPHPAGLAAAPPPPPICPPPAATLPKPPVISLPPAKPREVNPHKPTTKGALTASFLPSAPVLPRA